MLPSPDAAEKKNLPHPFHGESLPKNITGYNNFHLRVNRVELSMKKAGKKIKNSHRGKRDGGNQFAQHKEVLTSTVQFGSVNGYLS